MGFYIASIVKFRAFENIFTLSSYYIAVGTGSYWIRHCNLTAGG